MEPFYDNTKVSTNIKIFHRQITRGLSARDDNRTTVTRLTKPGLILIVSLSFILFLPSSAEVIAIVKDQTHLEQANLALLQNGSFENGLTGWKIVGRTDAPYTTTTNLVRHSGSFSLLLDYITPPPVYDPPGQGAEQTTSIPRLTGLRLEAWFYLPEGYDGELELRIDDLVVHYLVGSENKPPDTLRSRFVTVISTHCDMTWCPVKRDIDADFRSMFGSNLINSSKYDRPSNVTIVLWRTSGPPSWHSRMYWDDVQLTSPILAQTNSSITTAGRNAITIATTTTNPVATTITFSVTVTETKQIPIGVPVDMLYGAIVATVAVTFGTIMAVRMVSKRRRDRSN